MEEEEPSELKEPAPVEDDEDLVGPSEQEEAARLLRGYYREIEQRNLFQCLGLDRRLYEQIPVDDDQRLSDFFLASPLKLVTGIALGGEIEFGQAMQALGDELLQVREDTLRWSATLIKAPGSGVCLFSPPDLPGTKHRQAGSQP